MKTRAAAPLAPVQRTQLKALLFLGLARHFATPTAEPQDGWSLAELVAAAGELGLGDAASALGDALRARDAGSGVAAVHSRIFYQSTPPPYETSHAGGSAAELADIAGFYRAFGVTLSGDKPDHLVAELEFLALLLAKEARAVESGQAERAAVCADARARFLRDHLATWTDAFADAVGERHPGSVWSHLALASARCVRAEASEAGVEPIRRRLPPGFADRFPAMPGPRVDLDRPPCADAEPGP